MFITQKPEQHQFREGSILFRVDYNTKELLYTILYIQNTTPYFLPFKERKIRNQDHLEALSQTKNLEEIMKIERIFGFNQ